MTDHSTVRLAAAMWRELEGIPRSKPQPARDLAQAQDGLKLMGMAFSGGGIRSAAFNLGVLQGLEKLGLLHLIDYPSTVSGGYVGSLYLACLKGGSKVEKARDSAIHPLRRFSRYLAPQAEFFSGDAWSIAPMWLRNTLLLQTMLVSLFAAVLLSPRFLELWFLTFPEEWTTAAAALLFGWTGADYENIRHGLCLCQTILQLTQNVYLGLHLDTEWDHPDNKRWKALFLRSAGSPTTWEAYELSGSTFGDRFRQFCDRQLGLTGGEA